MSCTHYLCKSLKPPIVYFSLQYRTQQTFHNAHIARGFNHETLEEIHANHEAVSTELGTSIDAIQTIAAVIRHPYELELSSYNFFRNAKQNSARIFMNNPVVAQRCELAQKGFSAFLREWGYFRADMLSGKALRTEDYFMVDGKLPDKLALIRFENLADELPALVAPWATGEAIPFPHENASGSGLDPAGLGDEDKAFIYEKHAWLFDQGYYER